MRFWKPKKIAGSPAVGIAVAAYLNGDERLHHAYHALCHSLLAQTYPCSIHVWHDGPYESSQKPRPPGVVWYETEERKQQFGHAHRQGAIERLMSQGCEWIGLTNQDNYYVPTYLEWMVAEAQEKKAEFVYCDCVHSHKKWKPLSAQVRRGHIDLGSFLVHRSVAAKIKFDKFTFAGDWDYISRLVRAAKRHAHVAASLFVHN